MKQLGENQSKHENKDICTFGNQNILPVFAVIANFCHSVEDEKQTRFKKKKKKVKEKSQSKYQKVLINFS